MKYLHGSGKEGRQSKRPRAHRKYVRKHANPQQREIATLQSWGLKLSANNLIHNPQAVPEEEWRSLLASFPTFHTLHSRFESKHIASDSDRFGQWDTHSLAHTHTHNSIREEREGLHYIALTQIKDTLQIHAGKVEIGNTKYQSATENMSAARQPERASTRAEWQS